MKKLFLLLPLIFCLSACWDYEEPSAQNYVLCIGIDYEKENFILSVEAVKVTGAPTSLSASEGVVIEGSGKTLYDALLDAEAKAGKPLYTGHTEIVILSDLVTKEHFLEAYDFISRSSEIYSNVNLAVAKGASAKEILSAKTPQGGMVSTHIADIFENENKSHRFLCCEFWQLQRGFSYTLIPLIYQNDYPMSYGSAVFYHNSFIGYLSGDETQTFALVENCAENITLPEITIDNVTLSTKISDVAKTRNKIDIKIVLLNSSAPFDTVNPKMRKRLEERVSALISEQINALKSKPFGNPLSYSGYEIKVTLENSGLVKR